MTVAEYKKLYELIVDMSIDVEGNKDLTKLKWVKCMIECINDVPKRKADYYLPEFNAVEFLKNN